MRELIHFAHGNGFPALCYKQMLDRLAPRFNYCYIDKVGHSAQYKVNENWDELVDEIIASVTSQANQPVIAVGHSLGGIISMLAAIKEPSLFKAVIMLDAPIIGRFKSIMVRLAKQLNTIDRITPAYKTRGRRMHWQTFDQVMQYLKTRDLFKTFSEECLRDYITYGLEHKEDGYYLRFDRHIEYQIFRTIPHILPKLEGQLKTPAALIYGDKSTVVDRMDRRYMKKYFKMDSFKIAGTHLFPMESPQLVADKIIEVVDAILK